jgi:hypothetical protein
MKADFEMTNVRILFMVASLIVLCASKSHAQCASLYSDNGPDGSGNVHAWTILTDNFTNPNSGCAPTAWTTGGFTHTYSASVTVTSPSGRQMTGSAAGSQRGGVGTSVVRTDVTLPVDGESGTFSISGLDTIVCSVAGLIFSTTVNGTFSPPPPVINGISDAATASTTIYQGATGYLAIYGAALTAWGETPTPTVTGDSGLTLGTYWASDTQVNASYTVDAPAPVGQHTVTLQTAAGQAQGTIQVAASPNLTISQSNALWLFGVGNVPPPDFALGDIKTTLTTSGPTGGSFAWYVGSPTPGGGIPVQTNTLGRYLDHGVHSSITSPVR